MNKIMCQVNYSHLTLNAHLYSKNIVDSPLCGCGDIENSTHFCFSCSRYTVIRQNILAELVQQCTLKDLLYGKEGVSTTENERLFKNNDFVC